MPPLERSLELGEHLLLLHPFGVQRQVDGPASRSLSPPGATARALSNRGVLRALSGDVAGAARDLQSAVRSPGRSGTPERNLEYLASSPEYRERMALAERGAD